MARPATAARPRARTPPARSCTPPRRRPGWRCEAIQALGGNGYINDYPDRPPAARRQALRDRRRHVGDPPHADRPRAVRRDGIVPAALCRSAEDRCSLLLAIFLPFLLFFTIGRPICRDHLPDPADHADRLDSGGDCGRSYSLGAVHDGPEARRRGSRIDYAAPPDLVRLDRSKKLAGYSRAVVDGDWVLVAGTTGFELRGHDASLTTWSRRRSRPSGISRWPCETADCALADVVRVRYVPRDAKDWEVRYPMLRRDFRRHPAGLDGDHRAA